MVGLRPKGERQSVPREGGWLPDREKGHGMGAHPIDAQARGRLREAQQAEARALRAVTSAERHRREAKARLDAAERDVEAALHDLVRVSGDERAALLTATSVATLRRIKRTHAADGPDTPSD